MGDINNIHFEKALAITQRKHGYTVKTDGEQVLIEANLAVAYELRTQNLIALVNSSALNSAERTDILKEVITRLYQ